jgi:hypothetical protein
VLGRLPAAPPRRGGRDVTHIGHGPQRGDRALVVGVRVHGFDEVRHDVVAALQLHVDSAPRLVHLVPRADKCVERECHPDEQRDAKAHDDVADCHLSYVSTRTRPHLKYAAAKRAS